MARAPVNPEDSIKFLQEFDPSATVLTVNNTKIQIIV